MIIKVVITQHLVIDETVIPRKRDRQEWALGVVDRLQLSMPRMDGIHFTDNPKAVVSIVE